MNGYLLLSAHCDQFHISMASLIKGLGSLLPKRHGVTVFIYGNDASGKTTLLFRLKLGELVPTIPTIGFNVETIQHRKREFTLLDVGGKLLHTPLYVPF
jgi:hypothetical protein